MKLYNRETSYYTIITIPKCLVSKYGKKQIWRSLNTKDYKLAKLRAELETMSIRRKLLNDLNKQKEKTSKALDFAQILDDDDDDFFEDDIDIKDTVDFSHYTEEEFASFAKTTGRIKKFVIIRMLIGFSKKQLNKMIFQHFTLFSNILQLFI